MPVRIKICGITTTANADLAATLGVDWIGLNFYTKSPRYVDDATASAIIGSLPNSVEPVALFVNEPPDAMQRAARRLSIRTVQIHGELGAGSAWGELRWIPAFSVRDAADHVAGPPATSPAT